MRIEINQAPLLRKFVQTMRQLNIYLNHFPRHERHGLCARIRTTAYAVHDLIVEGMKRYHKKTTLTALDIAHEQLRMQCLLALFADGPGEAGIPIGNLLSQLYALVYLNEADHYIKRELKVRRYVRYVDDMVLIGMSRAEAMMAKVAIEEFLASRLRLQLSKWSIGRVAEGVNFVGYRTWPWGRLIRKYSLRKFRRAVSRESADIVGSLIAHAKNTVSLRYMSSALRGSDVFNRLPEAHKRRLAA